MTPLLPLDIWRAELGLHPWHFWGLADTQIVPVTANCDSIVAEYSWQRNDMAGRDDIRRAIERAEQALHTYLGYWPAPKYVETPPLTWPRFNDASQVRYIDQDATGRRVAMPAPDFYVQAMGIEQLSLIGSAAVVYSDPDGDTLDEFWTAQIATTETDPTRLAVYFSALNRLPVNTAVADRWRIQPVSISIAGGIATITGNTWLMVRPVLYQRPRLQAIDPTNPANFVATIEVYTRTTNGNGNSVSTAQATLQFESSDCGGWGSSFCTCGTANGSTDPGTIGEVIARAGIRDKQLGLITPAAAVYDSSSGAWASAMCSTCYAEPDRVVLRYLAGYPLGSDGLMAERWQQVVTMLGAAELKRRIAACRETNERLHDLQLDLTLESTETERYRVAQRDLENPFGTRLGHVQAWKRSKDHILRRGISA